MQPLLVKILMGAGAAVVAVVGTVAFLYFKAPAGKNTADVNPPPQSQSASPGPTVLPETPTAKNEITASFDVVRVEPTGELVVAGHGTPLAQIELLDGSVTIAQTQNDAGGQFAIVLPKPLAPGDHLLGLRASIPGGQSAISPQSVTVSVPSKGAGEVVVALVEPGKASRLLVDPAAKPAAVAASNPSVVQAPASPKPPAIRPSVTIRTAEVEVGGSFYATGTVAPGGLVKLYLNDSLVASVSAWPDENWSLKVTKGLVPGHYLVRADDVRESDGKVLSRAQVPFDYPEAKTGTAQASVIPPSAGNPAPKQAAPGTVTQAAVVELRTASVTRGDSLWRISTRILGNGTRYTQIYAANQGQIKDPDMIFPGQVLVVPTLAKP